MVITMVISRAADLRSRLAVHTIGPRKLQYTGSDLMDERREFGKDSPTGILYCATVANSDFFVASQFRTTVQYCKHALVDELT